MPKFNEYTEKTNPDDADIFLLQDVVSTKKTTFLGIFNQIRTKLGLGELAGKNKVSQSDLGDALTEFINGKLTASGIADDLITTDITKVLSAPQGKALLGYIGTLSSLSTAQKTNLVVAINEVVTSVATLNSNLTVKTRTIEGAYLNMQVTSYGEIAWVRISGYPKVAMNNGQKYTLFRPSAETPMYSLYRRISTSSTAGFIFQMSNTDAEVSITPFGADITTSIGVNVSECYIMK
uniref:hypothetical protein n=1 Tax=Faecalicatena contorta TaxID=39482 RepID=UPI00292648B7|nr:hypothetical protein AUSP0088_00064 [uncultured phage]